MDGICILLKEICDLFPNSPYIHIGGDEAAYPAWDHCTDCVAYMSNEGISVAVAAPEGGLQEEDVAVIADIVLNQSDYTLQDIRVVEVH